MTKKCQSSRESKFIVDPSGLIIDCAIGGRKCDDPELLAAVRALIL